jgi:hypothetical protein
MDGVESKAYDKLSDEGDWIADLMFDSPSSLHTIVRQGQEFLRVRLSIGRK